MAGRQRKNTLVAAAMGVFFGMLAFYYTNYISGSSESGVAVVRASEEIPPRTQLSLGMVEIDHVPEAFYREGTVREDELAPYVGRKVRGHVSEGDLLMHANFD